MKEGWVVMAAVVVVIVGTVRGFMREMGPR